MNRSFSKKRHIQESNLILEQRRFNKLLESKMGDVKPLVSEQEVDPEDPYWYPRTGPAPIEDLKPINLRQLPTTDPTPKELPMGKIETSEPEKKPETKREELMRKNDKLREFLNGKTVNLYFDDANTKTIPDLQNIFMYGVTDDIDVNSTLATGLYKFWFGFKNNPPGFNKVSKVIWEWDCTNQNFRAKDDSGKVRTLYNKSLSEFVSNIICTKGSGGVNVIDADFAQTMKSAPSNIA